MGLPSIYGNSVGGPYGERACLQVMRWHRTGPRGLAEIVGTLMLVLIVVAAATAFSFFVASYQKQLQAEETLSHNKNLEDLRIFGLIPTISTPPDLGNLRIELASLDVNSIVIEGVTLNGQAILTYTVTDSSGNPLSAPGCLNGNPFSPPNASCTIAVPADAQVFLDFNLQFGNSTYAFGGTDVTVTDTGLLQFDMFTSLGNEFVQSFVPPVAIAGVTFVESFPILDGTGSYQPGAGSNQSISINQWDWTVTSKPSGDPDDHPYVGQEVELPDPLSVGVSYTINLTVVNSESLSGTTSIQYELT